VIVTSAVSEDRPQMTSVTVGLTVKEKATLAALAKAEGVSMSAFGRQAIIARLQRRSSEPI
jgi:post-segregation antitoxin (ccd killing protein)